MSQTSGIVITPLRPEQSGDFLRSLAARGFKLVDAFPFKSGDSERAADHYHGPLPIFLDAGFSVLSEHKDLTVVRKLL
jgi:hypothetical protein